MIDPTGHPTRWLMHVCVLTVLLAPRASAAVLEDVTTASGLATLAPHKAAWADFNNDGWVDLYCGGKFWRNNGGTFTVMQSVAASEGIWGDYDNDGYVDLFIYSHRKLFRNVGGTSFVDRTSATLPSLPMTVTRGAAWGDFDNDGFLDLYIGGYEEPYQPDALLINNGGTSFSLVWQETGDIDPARGVSAADFDEDHDLDIYVSNYRLEANWLWRNDGSGGLTNVAHAFGAAGDYDGWSYSYGHTIGSSWGDLDNDGHFDLFVGNFSHPDAWQDRPKFLRNRGPLDDWHFEDKSAGAGLAWQESFASPALGDCDNDGDLDLFFTTVYAADHSVLMLNNRDWTFSDATAGWIPSPIAGTYQATWADYDNDGDLDLLSGQRLYRNTLSDSRWVKVMVVGGNGINRSAIGTQVRISADGGILLRQVESSTGESNGNDPVLHFGLGEDSGPVTLNVTWPDGSTDQVQTPVNTMVLVEKQDPAATPDPLAGSGQQTLVSYPNPLGSQTTIAFLLQSACELELSIHDISGRIVRDVFSGFLAAGSHAVSWDGLADDGSRLAAGVYHVRLITPTGEVSTKVILAK